MAQVSTPSPSPASIGILAWISLGSFFFVTSLLALLTGTTIFLPLALTGFALAFLLMLRRPLLLLGLLIIIRMSLDYSAQYISVTLQDLTLSLSQLLGVAIAALGLFLLGLQRKKLSHFPLLLPFLILFVWGTVTVAYSIDIGTTLSELLRFFDLFIIGFLAYTSVRSLDDYRALLVAIFFSGILPVVFGIYQFIVGIGLADEAVSVPRIFGTFSHPNVFSLYLFTLLALGSLSVIAYFRGRRERLVLLGFLSLVLVTLLLTYARIAWISLFVFAFLVAFWRYRAALIPLLFFPLLAFAISPSLQDRVVQSFHATPDSSIIWRQNLWHDAILATQMNHRELLGSGMDTFRIVSEDIRGTRFGSNESHNDFVKFYVEGGAIGVLIFCAYLYAFFYFFRRAHKESRHHPILYVSVFFLGFLLVGLLTASLSDNVFKNTPVQWLLWATLGGLAALLQHKSAQSRS